MTSPRIQANIVQNVTAGTSYTKEGETISAGRRIKRLEFDALKGNDKVHVAVATTWQKFIGKLGNEVVGTAPLAVSLRLSSGKKVALNVQSLAERLHLSEKEIISASKNKTLETYIDRKLFENRNLNEVLTQYQKKMDDWGGGFPSGEHPSKTSDLTPEILIRVIKAALNQSQPSGIVAPEESFSRHTFLYAKDLTNQNLVLLSEDQFKNQIGRGGFGQVFAATPEGVQNPNVVKLLRSDITDPVLRENAKRDLLNEVQILKKLNQGNRNNFGIMRTPHAVFNISGKKEYYGYLTDRFTCDAAHLGQPNNPYPNQAQVIQGFGQLLSGLERIQNQGISHGDIKTENISYNTNDGSWRLIDFGGARDISGLTQKQLYEFYQTRQYFGTSTPAYVSKSNRTKFTNGEVRNPDDYRKVMRERDNFAMGMSFLETVMGRGNLDRLFRYGKQGVEGCNLSKTEWVRQFQIRGYSPAIAEAVYNLMNIDEKTSSDVAQAKNAFIAEFTRLKGTAQQAPGIDHRLYKTTGEITREQYRSNILDPKNLRGYFQHLPPGSYALTKGLPGFEFCLYIKVKRGDHRSVNFNLDRDGHPVTKDGRIYNDFDQFYRSHYSQIINSK